MSRDYLDKKINKSGLLRLGRFCGEFKSRFRAACVGFFFFFVALYMPQLALWVKGVITLLVITCLIIVV